MIRDGTGCVQRYGARQTDVNKLFSLEDNWRAMGLDRMVTDRLDLTEIEKALNMMLNGENICKIIIDCQK